MQIEFLGTGGFHPNDRRETSCLMLPEIGVVFDAGTAAYRIARYLQTDSLDLFLSHAHLDHICGLTYLITLPLTGKIQEIRVHGRSVVLAAVRAHLFSDPVFPIDPPFQFHELEDEGSLQLPAGQRVDWRILPDHPGSSTAFRVVGDDSTMAYVTDTTVDGTYTDFIRGVDVLIHECYFPDEKSDWARKTGHTHAYELAQLAQEADVGQLVIIHTDPLDDSDDPVGLAGMRKVFPKLELAEDGLSLDFPS